MGTAKSQLRTVRAIPYNELPMIYDDDGSPIAVTKDNIDEHIQAFRDAHNIYIDYAGNNNVLALCTGDYDQEYPGDSICGQVGLRGPGRRQQMFGAVKNKLPSDPNAVQVNHGFDALARVPFSDEVERTDPETGDSTPAVERTDFDRFERRVTKVMGEG